MSRSRRSQWINAALFAAAGILLLLFSRAESFAESVLFPILLLGVAVASSPVLKRRSVSHAAALESDADVVVYHRPGCTYCIRLKASLGGRAHGATWVDIWEDEAAAVYVRSVNEGDETVPTVVIDGVAHTNPPPSMVKARLAGASRPFRRR